MKKKYDALKTNSEQMGVLKEERQKLLGEIEKEIKEDLEGCPEGRLCVKSSKGRNYYFKKAKKSKKRGCYIRRRDAAVAEGLASREYLENLAAIISKEQWEIDNLRLRDVGDVFSKMSKYKRGMVNPIYLSDEEFIANWEAEEYQGKSFDNVDTEFFTAKGERVRSKSEVLICDKLNSRGIPYKYEKPVYIDGVGLLYPDFTCLNVRLRREIIYEHFGMIDNPEYAANALWKISQYIRAGYIPGVNFFFTMESSRSPLSMRQLDEEIERYLL